MLYIVMYVFYIDVKKHTLLCELKLHAMRKKNEQQEAFQTQGHGFPSTMAEPFPDEYWQAPLPRVPSLDRHRFAIGRSVTIGHESFDLVI